MFDSERSSDGAGRRRFLAAAGSVAVTGLTAGCFDQSEGQSGNENLDDEAQNGEGAPDTPSTERDAASGQEGGFDPTATQTETPEGGTPSLTGTTNTSATGGGSDDETGTAETTTANRTTRSN